MSILFRFFLVGAIFVGFQTSSKVVSSQEIVLKFANWLPPVHHWTKTARDFADSIEKAGAGKIKVTIDKGPLAKPPGQFDLAVNGVRDMMLVDSNRLMKIKLSSIKSQKKLIKQFNKNN